MDYQISLSQGPGKKMYVVPEGEEGFFLYPSEVRKLKLKEGMSLSGEELNKIRLLFALPRAKKRAMGILVKQDKTVQELREKLIGSGHDSRSTEEALRFVIGAGYVDDDRYARDYIHARRRKRSDRMIRMELLRKGIAPDLLELVFEEEGPQNRSQVEDAVRKYMSRFPEPDLSARQKTCAHFYRKGYDSGLIREIVEELASDWQACR